MFQLPVKEVERRPDTGYRTIGNDDVAMDILSEALSMGFGDYASWMNKIELNTVDSYEKFNRMADSLGVFQTDVSKVIMYSKSLKYRENLLDTPPALDFHTYIQSTSGELISTMSHLLPQVRDSVSEDEYDMFKESLARIMWLRANISRTASFPSEYSPEEMDELESVFEKFGNLMQGLDSRNPDGTFKPRYLEQKEIPKKFTYLINIVQYSMMLGTAFEATAKTLGSSVARVTDACTGMTNWGDFKTNPVGTLVGIMNSLGESYIAGGEFYVAVVDLGNRGVQAIGKKNGKTSLKTLKAMSPNELTFKAVSRVIGMLSKLSTGIFSFTTSIMTSAFSMFTSILTSTMKIIKSIAETSPIVKTISDYLGLVLSMFFLPFFSAFGEPLLDAMMVALTALADAGVQFITWLQNADESVKKDIDDVLSTMVLDIEDILDKFMNAVVTDFEELVPPMLAFILQFSETIIDNSEMILNLLKTGIDAMNDMIENNILFNVMNLSKMVFEFIYENRGFVKDCTNAILNAINGALSIVSWCLNNLKLATIVLCEATATICGAIGGAQIGTMLAPLTLGASILVGTLVGAGIGAGAGAVAAYEIIKHWIDPAEALMNQIKYKQVPAYGSGGKIYGRRGGHIGLLGEAGQGEYAIPQSKMGLFRGNNNIVLRFKKGVYNQKEIESVLKELKTEVQFDYIFD